MNIKRSAALIMIAVLLLCGLSGCKDGQGFDSDTPSVAIIIKGSESDFWNDVKKGALSAATEFNIDITNWTFSHFLHPQLLVNYEHDIKYRVVF